MGQTTQTPRKRPDAEALTTEGSAHVPKKNKPTGSSPAPTTPGAKGDALQSSKERTNETGQARAPTPASRTQLPTPRASTAADTLTILAGGTISKDEYKEECQKAKAQRTRRDGSPANTSPAAPAADTPKKAKSLPSKPVKPVMSDERKGKANHKKGKANHKVKAANPKPTDSDNTTWSESFDSDQASVEPSVNQPPGKVEALSGERMVRPTERPLLTGTSLPPLRFSNLQSRLCRPTPAVLALQVFHAWALAICDGDALRADDWQGSEDARATDSSGLAATWLVQGYI